MSSPIAETTFPSRIPSYEEHYERDEYVFLSYGSFSIPLTRSFTLKTLTAYAESLVLVSNGLSVVP